MRHTTKVALATILLLASCTSKTPDATVAFGFTYLKGQLIDIQPLAVTKDMADCRAQAVEALKAHPVVTQGDLTVKLGCAAVEFQ